MSFLSIYGRSQLLMLSSTKCRCLYLKLENDIPDKNDHKQLGNTITLVEIGVYTFDF